jgi:hypothetical protein
MIQQIKVDFARGVIEEDVMAKRDMAIPNDRNKDALA